MSWLLDTCFVFPPGPLSGEAQGQMFLRSECWHTRNGSAQFPSALPFQANTILDEALERAEELGDDFASIRDDIEELSTMLDEAKDRLEQKTTALQELVSAAKDSKVDAASAAEDFAVALLQQHRKGATEGIDPSVEQDDPIEDAESALDDLEAHATSIADEIDGFGDDAETTTDDIYATLWTNSGYARGQNILRIAKVRELPVDLTFLGALQKTVDRLSEDARKMLHTVVNLYHLATDKEFLEELDHGVIIGSMAKACERMFADAFQIRKAAVNGHPGVQRLLTEPGNWDFEIPPVAKKADKNGLCRMLNQLKRGINKERIHWNGTSNCGFALLLLGGRVVARKGKFREKLNLLGLSSDDEVLRLPGRLIEFQDYRNGFIHHDLATLDDVKRVWECFSGCVRGLLTAFYRDPC